jgi:hypothetical protein
MKPQILLTFTTAASLMLLSGWGAIASSIQPISSPSFLLAHEQAQLHEGMQPGLSPADEHDHDSLEIPAGQPVPTVTLVAHPDAQTGWNLEVQTTNFRFAPERVNQPGSPAEGHAHLYIDGEKVTRLYGNWHYLGSLPSGRHEITVSLNTNEHQTLMHNREPVQATTTVEVPTASR